MYKLILTTILFFYNHFVFCLFRCWYGWRSDCDNYWYYCCNFFALFGLIWFPIKRLLKKEKKINNKIRLINQFLIIFSVIIVYEFIRYVKLIDIVRSNLKIYQKILKLFKFKTVSDLRKEKLILNYSKSLFIVSIKIFTILISILIFMYILDLLSDSFLNLVISFLGIIELTIVFIIYHLLRKKYDAKL